MRVIDTNHLDGIMVTLTEMVIQDIPCYKVANIIRPMNLSESEIIYMVESCGGEEWREVYYIEGVFKAWLESLDEDDV